MFGEMRRDRADEQGTDPDEMFDQVNVHTDVDGDVAISITSRLDFVEPVFESVLIIGSFW